MKTLWIALLLILTCVTHAMVTSCADSALAAGPGISDGLQLPRIVIDGKKYLVTHAHAGRVTVYFPEYKSFLDYDLRDGVLYTQNPGALYFSDANCEGDMFIQQPEVIGGNVYIPEWWKGRAYRVIKSSLQEMRSCATFTAGGTYASPAIETDLPGQLQLPLEIQ